MSQPLPIEKFGVKLFRCQVPTDSEHPHGESIIAEVTPLEGLRREPIWLMLSPQESIDLGRGLIAEGELARTGLYVPESFES